MFDFLNPLMNTIQQQCSQFFSWVESISSDHATSPPTILSSEVERVMVKVMLGVQQVMTCHKEQLSNNKKRQEEEDNDCSDTLLFKMLHEVSLKNVCNMKTSDVSVLLVHYICNDGVSLRSSAVLSSCLSWWQLVTVLREWSSLRFFLY